jgi:hypothetical protein
VADIDFLMGTVLSTLVVEDVADGGDAVVVSARTRDVAVACPVCRRRRRCTVITAER